MAITLAAPEINTISRTSKTSKRTLGSKRRSQEAADLDSMNAFDRDRKRSRSTIEPIKAFLFESGWETLETSPDVLMFAEMMVDFFDELVMLYELKLQTPVVLDIDTRINDLAAQIENDNTFPARPEDATSRADEIYNAYKCMLQVYKHLYEYHYDHFCQLGASEHLNACCHRLTSFISHYRVLPKEVLSPILQFLLRKVMNLTGVRVETAEVFEPTISNRTAVLLFSPFKNLIDTTTTK